jgi:hypothetical protein
MNKNIVHSNLHEIDDSDLFLDIDDNDNDENTQQQSVDSNISIISTNFHRPQSKKKKKHDSKSQYSGIKLLNGSQFSSRQSSQQSQQSQQNLAARTRLLEDVLAKINNSTSDDEDELIRTTQMFSSTQSDVVVKNPLNDKNFVIYFRFDFFF